MRAIWKGALAFGMVSIPVRLYSATEDRDVSFHQVHDDDAGRVRYRRVCEVCDNAVAYAALAKGFELPSGETVNLTD
ncbi:MAG: Ku protein, partial [Pseudonocardiaceae bacterium]